MTHARLEISPGLWLDARRAVWIEEHRALLVADLHLGYVWAHRAQGNMLPISVADDTLDRLQLLALEYAPCEIIVLGDIIHAAVMEAAVIDELTRLHTLAPHATVRLIAGNHDAKLAPMLERAGLDVPLVREFMLGNDLLLHGDLGDEAMAEERCRAIVDGGGRVIIGHEHPALTLSDGVATSLRCPCFLAADDVLVLPAFSPWSAGTNVRHGVFLSPYIRRANVTQTIAIVGNRLLPMGTRR